MIEIIKALVLFMSIIASCGLVELVIENTIGYVKMERGDFIVEQAKNDVRIIPIDITIFTAFCWTLFYFLVN